MRKGLFVLGLVLLIIGIAAAGLTFQQTSSGTVPEFPNGTIATLGDVTDGTMTVSWSGGTASTVVNVSQCADSSCQTFTSTVGSGHGASGSLSFSVGSGDVYAVYTYSPGVSATIQIDGFVPLTFIGIVLAAVGAFLLVIGVLARAKVRPAPAEVAPPTDTSFSMGAPPGMATSPPEDAGTVMPPPPAASAPSTPGQMVKCASCGTLNEMWLHNCRWCKRPLTSTSGDAATG